MASKPEVRERVLYELGRIGPVHGSTFGTIARRLKPSDASVNDTKKALNSLTYRGQTQVQRTGDPRLDGNRGGFVVRRVQS